MNHTKIENYPAVYNTGRINAPPVIFVHGFPYDHYMWDKQVGFLSKDYFCITYDIRGLGKCPAGDGQYTMEMFTDDLFLIIKELNISKPVLCSLSMGGYMALRAVERNERAFSALILCDTRSSSDADPVKLKRAAGIKKINTEGAEKYVAEFVPGCFTEKFINSGKAGKNNYAEILQRSVKSDPAGLKGCLLAMAGRTDTTSYLKKIKIPVLLLCGDHDKLTPPDEMKQMADQIEGSQFYIVPDAAHMSPVENPEFVNQKILSLIKSIFF